MAVKFKYKNHKGEIADRTVTIEGIERIRDGISDYGYPAGCWVLVGWDHDKDARRSFLLENIIAPEDKKFFGVPFRSKDETLAAANVERIDEQG